MVWAARVPPLPAAAYLAAVVVGAAAQSASGEAAVVGLWQATRFAAGGTVVAAAEASSQHRQTGLAQRTRGAPGSATTTARAAVDVCYWRSVGCSAMASGTTAATGWASGVVVVVVVAWRNSWQQSRRAALTLAAPARRGPPRISVCVGRFAAAAAVASVTLGPSVAAVDLWTRPWARCPLARRIGVPAGHPFVVAPAVGSPVARTLTSVRDSSCPDCPSFPDY